MIYFYWICFLVTLGFLIGFLCYGERNSLQQNLTLLLATISNGGYVALVLSSNLSEALLATKITYIAGCFLPFYVFLVTCQICRVKVPKICLLGIHIFQTLLFLCVCTIGVSDIYYKAVEMHQLDGATYLAKTYGPGHLIYVITFFGYALISILVALKALTKRSMVSDTNVYIIIFSYVLVLILYAADRIWDWEYDIVPLFYIITIIGLLVPINRINRYNIYENMKEIQDVRGYLAFDKRLRYKGSNDFALNVFPEFQEYVLDDEVPEEKSLFYEKAFPLLQKYITKHDRLTETDTITLGDMSYELKLSPILGARGREIGYLLEISDVTAQQKYVSVVEHYNKNLEREVANKTNKIREIQDKTILGMAQMVESRDLSTGGHIKRTSSVVKIFSEELLKADVGFAPEFLHYLEKSAPMHDLGKIAVDDRILRKQGKFTDEEYTKMKEHAAAGAEIVNNILVGIEDEQFVSIAVNVAHYHHEKVNGTGYPNGLKGDDIPIEARIMALADVFDALVSKRCYKEAFSFDKAFSIIEESAGEHFDTELTEIFMKCRPKLEALYRIIGE